MCKREVLSEETYLNQENKPSNEKHIAQPVNEED
jgi:hypothetical protein